MSNQRVLRRNAATNVETKCVGSIASGRLLPIMILQVPVPKQDAARPVPCTTSKFGPRLYQAGQLGRSQAEHLVTPPTSLAEASASSLLVGSARPTPLLRRRFFASLGGMAGDRATAVLRPLDEPSPVTRHRQLSNLAELLPGKQAGTS